MVAVEENIMDNLEFIRKHQGTLGHIAKSKLQEVKDSQTVYGNDGWFEYTKNFTIAREESIDNVDINIWLQEGDETEPDAWVATAYPMEINSVGEIQTNTQDFLQLWRVPVGEQGLCAIQ